MKHFFIGLAILTLLLFLGLGVQWSVNDAHMAVADTLEQAAKQTLEGNWEQATTLVKEAKGNWAKGRYLTAALEDHAHIDEIDGLFVQLVSYEKTRDAGHFSAICAQLSILVEAVADGHRLTWWSLL